MSNLENFEIRCEHDDKFSHERLVTSSCGCIFSINEEDIYSVKNIDYFGDDLIEYYVICPKCGYINMLDASKLSNDLKERINARCFNEPFLFQRNSLMSKLVYLDGLGNYKVLARRK